MKRKYSVSGMTCSACQSHVQKAVSKVEGVVSCNVNLLTNTMEIECVDTLKDEMIFDAVNDAGYKATYKSDKIYEVKKGSVKLIIISFVILVLIMFIQMGYMFELYKINELIIVALEIILVIPVVIINRKYFKNGFKNIVKASPNMDTLVALGVTASIVYSLFSTLNIIVSYINNNYEMMSHYTHDMYYESAVMILTFVSFGKYLEERSKRKTTSAIEDLINLAPDTGRLIENGVETMILTKDIKKDNILLVKPGEKIPSDGIIIDGMSYIDESMITGEAIPNYKKINDLVVGGTINKEGNIKIKATNIGKDSTLNKIIALVDEAASSKAPISKLADKISGIFVPIVILISIITFVCWIIGSKDISFSLQTAISVLVISCPCALGLATPVAIMVGTGRGAKLGIIYKNAYSLELLGKAKTIVFDKTGTITNGVPELTDVIGENFLQLIGSLESMSSHPISECITKYVKKDYNLLKVSNFENFLGKGIKGTINGVDYYSGNLDLMRKYGISIDKEKYQVYQKEAKTVTYFASSQGLLGVICVKDVPKYDSKYAIKILTQMGLDVIMLTGDNELTANRIKEELDIKECIANVKPEEKESVIKKLQEKGKVIMVGDGINDAIALKRADIGIAIGSGTDVAIESADVVIMNNSLITVANAIKLSQQTIKNIKENLFWALFYNALCIPLACGLFFVLFGIKLEPMYASVAMSFSSIFVVSNALRLRYFKEIEGEKVKTIIVDGMMCSHCANRVMDALLNIGAKKVNVRLKKKEVIIDTPLNDDDITRAITDAGYKVIEIRGNNND